MTLTRRWALSQRFATQRLSSAPLTRPDEVVRLLLCVQSQDPPLAAYSLGLRCRDEAAGAVLAAQDRGGYVRTHILRPTWHYVCIEDLRWLVDLTGRKVEAGMAARHRGLGFDDLVVGAGLAYLEELLAPGVPLTRKQIGPAMAARGLPGPGERVGHLLIIAELRGLICSGPMAGRDHTYLLVDQVAPPTDRLGRDEALARLVARFFAGHGPATITDLTRWAAVNQGDVARGLAATGSALESGEIDGQRHWWDPATVGPVTRDVTTYLLPVFDEAYLTYPRLNIERTSRHPFGAGPARFNEAGGGVVVDDLREIGVWKRFADKAGVRIVLQLDPAVTERERQRVDAAADRLAAFIGQPRVGSAT